MPKQLKKSLFLAPLLTSLLFLASTNIFGSENFTTVNLNLKHRALYVTYCDINNDGLKDIIAADEHNITIFKQKSNLSYESSTLQSKEKIKALNPIQLNNNGKEGILCIGEDNIFYFYYNNADNLEGPNYIEIAGHDQIALIEKQKNIRNFSFVVDLNNDGLDDIILPANDGLFILWQTEALVFKPFFLPIQNIYENISMNIRYWPKSDKKIDGYTKGMSFFPTYTKSLSYWMQDYNNDELLDIITQTESSEGYIISVYLQTQNNDFQKAKIIFLQRVNTTEKHLSELRFLDFNNDNFLDIVETGAEYPLEGNSSLLPLITIKIYLARDTFEFDANPSYLFKTVFIPGLDNIVNLDNDGPYEIITAPSPLKLESKESIINIATNKEIVFTINYGVINDTISQKIKNINLGKTFSMAFSGIKDFNKFNRFLKLIDLNADNIYDIFLLKKNTVIEIDIIKKKKHKLVIDKYMDIRLPFAISEIDSIDINLDNSNDFLILDETRKRISVIYPMKLCD